MSIDAFHGIHNVPVCTTSVLCTVQIFGFGIENRKVLFDVTRHSLVEMENLTNYALNPFLPKYKNCKYADDSPEIRSLQNVGQMLRFFKVIHQKYFELLIERGYSGYDKKQREYMYSTQEELGSLYKRYMILSAMDGINPYNLQLNWSAEFNFGNDELRRKIIERLDIARERVKNLRNMDCYYSKKGHTLTTPVHLLTQQLKAFLSHLGEAAYLNAAGFCEDDHPLVEKGRKKICDNIEKARRHLDRLIMDLLKCELYTIIKYFGKNNQFDEAQRMGLLGGAIKARAEDHAPVCCIESSGEYEICEDTFKRHYDIYKGTVDSLYGYAGYDPDACY